MIDLKERLSSAIAKLISESGVKLPFEAVMTDSGGYLLAMRYQEGKEPEKTCESSAFSGDVTFPVSFHLFDSTGDMVRRAKFIS